MTDTQQPKSLAPLTVDQAAAFLGLSVSYIYRLTSKGRLPHFKSRGGKRVYFHPADLRAWAFGRRVTSDDEVEQTAAEYVHTNPL